MPTSSFFRDFSEGPRRTSLSEDTDERLCAMLSVSARCEMRNLAQSPKSESLMCPLESIRMLSGFRSRWM